ncbi:MAG: tRNA lysidine(34) synthetase TilS [Maritimibacter sp.]|nr:tRNA lysidine(34) synthetase TilS [Maritimibacter sp.]
MALLQVLAGCAPDLGISIVAATVDHGLRAGSAEDAHFVETACKALGIQHETLRWQDWDGTGNLQAEARAARYRLLGDWARRHRLDAVALAHTMDDQAETFLMRLAREAGVDGLAAMEQLFQRDGMSFLRPALGLRRADLRDYLARHRLDWREDPSNEDARFDRVKARRVLAALGPLGIDAGTLAGVAGNMAAARSALWTQTVETAERISREVAGDVVFDRKALTMVPWEIQRRLYAAALAWISGAQYPPRRDGLVELDIAIVRGEPRTLHGCLVTSDDASTRFAREPNAAKHAIAPFGSLWDNRWQVTGPGEGLTIRALGEAVSQCPDWRASGLPRASLMASPAVWDGQSLVSAPIAGFSNGFSAEINHPRGHFLSSLLSD